jgi:hypothetical protein
MNDFPIQALIPIGVISAALIAGFFSLLNLIVSKEQKVSEFRQQWIDSLRQELADHMAAVVSLSSIYENGQHLDKEMTKTANEVTQRVTSTFISIKLRINPEDSDLKIREMNIEILRLLDEGRGLFSEGKWKEARLKCNEITEASIPMLKEEWKRVKKGENVYVWFKRIAIGLFVLSLSALAYAAFTFWPSTAKTGVTPAPPPGSVRKAEPKTEMAVDAKQKNSPAQTSADGNKKP